MSKAQLVRTACAREHHGVAKASLGCGLEVGEGILESLASKVGPEGHTSRVIGQVRKRERPGPAGEEQVLRPGGEPKRGLPAAWPEHSTPRGHQRWSRGLNTEVLAGGTPEANRQLLEEGKIKVSLHFYKFTLAAKCTVGGVGGLKPEGPLGDP